MNFIEASKMKEGTKFTLEEYDNYGYLYFSEGSVYSDKGIPQQASVDLIKSQWAVVEEEYTLQSKIAMLCETNHWPPGYFSVVLKEYRDLILKDINKLGTCFTDDISSDIEPIINKRFGGLK